MDQAEIALEQSRFNLALAEDALARAELVAPGSGTVLSIDTASGATVGAGTPIVTLLDADHLEFLTTNLSERDLANISRGQAAVVTLKAYPDDPIDAKVARVGVKAGPTVGDAATFPIVLALSDASFAIRPGMTGRAEIRSED